MDGVDRLPTGLRMDLDAMLAAGLATVEAMARRMDQPSSDPVLRRASPEQMQARLAAPPPETATDFSDVLRAVLDDVLPFASRTDHPGYFAFIPSFTTWPAAMAELVAAAANPYCGAWMEAAGPAQLELEVLGWFRDWLGLPATTSGVLVSGGSAANLTALMTARTAAASAGPDAVLYVSDQAHSSLARTARVLGLEPSQVRVIPTDDRQRMGADHLEAALVADRRLGRSPMAVCASAGSTNSGAVDPLDALADVCQAAGVWLHVDAAYGGFAALTERGRTMLAGLERADSVTLDPHKWLFQPMECGAVLVRDGGQLEATFGVHADYLAEARTRDPLEVDFSDRGLQLSRGFRALKIWMSVQTFGLGAFRAAVDHSLDLAVAAAERVAAADSLELMSGPELSIVCFRRTWPGVDEDEIARRNGELAAALERSGRALVSTTRLHGRFAVRMCVLNPTSDLADVEAVIDHFATGMIGGSADGLAVTPAGRDGAISSVSGSPGDLDPTVTAGSIESLGSLALFGGLEPALLDRLAEVGAVVDFAAGHVVISQWGTDRIFYVVMAGEVEVSVDDRVVRRLGRDSFFGELAAQDWGAGYGYSRLATVTATEPVRLFALPGHAFAALLEQAPDVRRQIEAATRDRLREV